LSMTRWVLEQENQQGKPLSLAELQVLAELMWERRATTPELAHVVQRTDAETRNILARMVERGWVEARGEGKGRSWHLSAAVYRVLEAPPVTSVCTALSHCNRNKWSCNTSTPTPDHPDRSC
jgi:ATP-dependent DNA helicase RecG